MFHVKQAQKVAGFIYNLPQNLLFVLEKKHSQITSISANIYWLILLKNSCLLLSSGVFYRLVNDEIVSSKNSKRSRKRNGFT